MKGFNLLSVLLLLTALTGSALAAGSPPGDAFSIGVGLQGRWLDQGDTETNSDLEAAGNGAFSLTPHVSVTGGVAFGFQGSYFREQADVRITATDVNDPNFNIWLGAGRYWSKDLNDGLDEWAGKAGIGYRLPTTAPLIVGATAAYGFDTERRQVTLALIYRLRDVKKGATAQ
jgi:hypothetical protein